MFLKAYKPNWTNEVFVIKSVKKSDVKKQEVLIH